MFRRDSGLILSLDVNTLEKLRELLNISCDEEYVVGYKVGFSLTIRYGLAEVMETIREYTEDKPIIYDHQKGGTDIPRMGDVFMQACKDCFVEGVILFPLSGPNTLEAWVKAGFKQELVPIVGGLMTHEGYLVNEDGYLLSNCPERIYDEARQLGVKYFVLPGNKPEIIRRLVAFPLDSFCERFSILMPGIGTQGGEIKKSFDACGKHKPYAIVGSSIYQVKDPREALDGYVKEIKEWEIKR